MYSRTSNWQLSPISVVNLPSWDWTSPSSNSPQQVGSSCDPCLRASCALQLVFDEFDIHGFLHPTGRQPPSGPIGCVGPQVSGLFCEWLYSHFWECYSWSFWDRADKGKRDVTINRYNLLLMSTMLYYIGPPLIRPLLRYIKSLMGFVMTWWETSLAIKGSIWHPLHEACWGQRVQNPIRECQCCLPSPNP